jgi:hypothetical protein
MTIVSNRVRTINQTTTNISSTILSLSENTSTIIESLNQKTSANVNDRVDTTAKYTSSIGFDIELPTQASSTLN